MSSTPYFPLIVSAPGSYLLCAAGDLRAAAGTLIQCAGTGTWSVNIQQNVAAGVEPPVLQPIPVINRATGYLVPVAPNGQLFATADSPFTVEVPSCSGDLYATVTMFGTAAVGFVVSPAQFSVLRPAGASLFDLNFDALPIAALDTEVEDDLEIMVAAYNSQP